MVKEFKGSYKAATEVWKKNNNKKNVFI